jgi:hypothetical protein
MTIAEQRESLRNGLKDVKTFAYICYKAADLESRTSLGAFTYEEEKLEQKLIEAVIAIIFEEVANQDSDLSFKKLKKAILAIEKFNPGSIGFYTETLVPEDVRFFVYAVWRSASLDR